MSLFCPRCGAPHEAEASQCEACGEVFSSRTSPLGGLPVRGRVRGRGAGYGVPEAGDGVPETAYRAPGANRVGWGKLIVRVVATGVFLACLGVLGIVIGVFAPALVGRELRIPVLPGLAAGNPEAASGAGAGGVASAGAAGEMHLIGGEIFSSPRPGAGGVLSGNKVHLVRAEEFRAAYGEILERMFARRLGVRLLELQKKEIATAAELGKREALVSDKTRQIEECIAQRWSEFTYVDPVTDRESKQVYQVTLKNADASVIAMMRKRLDALRKHIGSLRREQEKLQRETESALAELRRLQPQIPAGAQGGVPRALHAMEPLMHGIRTAADVEARTASDLVAALDRATADTVHAGVGGVFVFDGQPAADYLVYANCADQTWLVPVKWLKDGRPDKVVLASQNTVNLEEKLRRARAGNLLHALDELMR